jgi:hypothetical protein
MENRRDGESRSFPQRRSQRISELEEPTRTTVIEKRFFQKEMRKESKCVS